jgi:hypothetical protein
MGGRSGRAKATRLARFRERQTQKTSALGEHEHAMFPQAVRVGERVGLAHAAARRDRVEVADMGPLPPHRACLGDEIVDAESPQPVGLARLGHEPQADAGCRGAKLLRRHVIGDVLLARGVERAGTPLLAAVRPQPLGLAPGRDGSEIVGVIDDHQKTVAEHACALRQPVGHAGGDRKPRARLDGKVGGVLAGVGREVTRRGNQDLHEPAGAVDPDAYLLPTACRPFHQTKRQVVEELVGDHDAVESDRGELVEGGHDGTRPCDGDGRLAWNPGQRGAPRVLDRRAVEAVARTAAVAGAGIDHEVRVGRAHPFPCVVERTSHQRAEERADLGARDEVAPAPPCATPSREEPVGRIVERSLDERVERDRPLPVDPLDYPRPEAGHFPLR